MDFSLVKNRREGNTKSMQTIDAPIIPAPPTEKPTVPDFGNGRFGPQMLRLYEQSIKLFKLTPRQAEVFARQAATDAGAELKRAQATIKISKANTDGKATISDASKMKGCVLTSPLWIARAIQWAGDAGANGVSYGLTSWTLVPEVRKWVDSIE